MKSKDIDRLDYFAGLAMQAYLKKMPYNKASLESDVEIAMCAYCVAEAMVDHRKKIENGEL
jgi:hypothetical protein